MRLIHMGQRPGRTYSRPMSSRLDGFSSPGLQDLMDVGEHIHRRVAGYVGAVPQCSCIGHRHSGAIPGIDRNLSHASRSGQDRPNTAQSHGRHAHLGTLAECVLLTLQEFGSKHLGRALDELSRPPRESRVRVTPKAHTEVHIHPSAPHAILTFNVAECLGATSMRSSDSLGICQLSTPDLDSSPMITAREVGVVCSLPTGPQATPVVYVVRSRGSIASEVRQLQQEQAPILVTPGDSAHVWCHCRRGSCMGKCLSREIVLSRWSFYHHPIFLWERALQTCQRLLCRRPYVRNQVELTFATPRRWLVACA